MVCEDKRVSHSFFFFSKLYVPYLGVDLYNQILVDYYPFNANAENMSRNLLEIFCQDLYIQDNCCKFCSFKDIYQKGNGNVKVVSFQCLGYFSHEKLHLMKTRMHETLSWPFFPPVISAIFGTIS